MHTKERLSSNNSWQNQGIMRQFAKDNIEKKYIELFLDIVDESFSYGRKKTLHKTIDEWAKKFKVSRSTFERHIAWLSKNDFIKINTWKEYIPGGGSKPNSYSPCFPKGYAKIKLKEEEENISQEDKENAARKETDKLFG